MAATPDHDVIIIGAGMSGIYSLYRTRGLGLRVKVIEAGSDLGGTWYWNRYPGARFDSESYSYTYSFSKELLDGWDWTEHFAPQPETRKYINYVCDKLDLRKDMQFDTRIRSAHFQEDTRSWELIDENGRTYKARFLIAAVGGLSTPTLPNILGVKDFKGVSFHTSRWPREEPVDFRDKRVGIIGTGATAVQTIQEVVKTVGHLTVFQRTPNWCAPLHNAKISKEEMEEIRRNYPKIFQRCQETAACFLHTTDPRNTFDVTPEEREAFWENLYASPGFGVWMGNFKDMLYNKKANDLFSEFIARKIRQRVKDPETAEKLIPKNHGFGTRRVPLETKYYEAYNQPNVRLVDINETPIECITEKGIKTSAEDFELDIIIYATGFDAITGSYNAIDIQGLNHTKLTDKWKDGPKTYLGLTVEDFPNLFMMMGPHQAVGNIPRLVEYGVGWITDLLRYCRDHDISYVEPTKEGVVSWTEHVFASARGLLSNDVDSWLTGVNKNVAGKQTRTVMRYNGGVPAYRRRCDEVAANDYKGMKLLV